MVLNNQINPTKEQIEELKKMPVDQPVVMVNILKLHSENGNAYQSYLKNVVPFIEAVGGRLIWKGKGLLNIIGEGDVADVFLLVEYPSLNKFFELIFNPEYQKIAKDRELGLQYGGLIAADTEYSIW